MLPPDNMEAMAEGTHMSRLISTEAERKTAGEHSMEAMAGSTHTAHLISTGAERQQQREHQHQEPQQWSPMKLHFTKVATLSIHHTIEAWTVVTWHPVKPLLLVRSHTITHNWQAQRALLVSSTC